MPLIVDFAPPVMYRPAEPFVLAAFLTAHPRVASVSLWVVTELAMRTALASSPVRFAYSLLLPQPSLRLIVGNCRERGRHSP